MFIYLLNICFSPLIIQCIIKLSIYLFHFIPIYHFKFTVRFYCNLLFFVILSRRLLTFFIEIDLLSISVYFIHCLAADHFWILPNLNISLNRRCFGMIHRFIVERCSISSPSLLVQLFC